MNPGKKSLLSQDLANILSRVNVEHEPPYKKFRSRSEETFYSINALDLEDYDEELTEDDSSLFGLKRLEPLENGLSSHNTGERNGGFSAALTTPLKVGQNQYNDNKLDSVLTNYGVSINGSKHVDSKGTDKRASGDKGNEKQNFSSSDKMKDSSCNYGNEVAAIADGSLQELDPQGQINHTAYKVRDIKHELRLNGTNGADIKEEKENIDYTVGNILQDFCRRQEQSNELVQAVPHDRVYNLDDYDVDEFYMDDNVDLSSGGGGGGSYSVTPSDTVPHLSVKPTLESISDILNRTLDTIPEGDEDDVNENLQSESEESGVTGHSTKVEPRSECNSFMTTPRGELVASDTKVDSSKASEPVEYTWGQWDNQLNSGYAVSEDLSDVASFVHEDTPTESQSKLSKSTLTSLHSVSEPDPMSKMDKMKDVAKTERDSDRNKVESNGEVPWYEEESQDIGGASVSGESYHSVASTPSKLPSYVDTQRHSVASKPELLESISGNLGHNDSTETLKEEEKTSESTVSDNSGCIKVSEIPLSGMAKVFDWETADLNSEIAESIVLSDYVSDVETDSRFGSSVSNHPKAAMEAINNLVKENQKSEAIQRKDIDLKKYSPPSDSAGFSSSSTAHSITSAPGQIESLPFNTGRISANETPRDTKEDRKVSEEANLNTDVQKCSEISPSSVKYDCFTPGFSSSQFSIGTDIPSTSPAKKLVSDIPETDTHVSEKGVDNIPRIYVSDGFDSFSGSLGPDPKELTKSGETLISNGNVDELQGKEIENYNDTQRTKDNTKNRDTLPTHNDTPECAPVAPLPPSTDPNTPRSEDFMQEWKQKVNEIFDPVTPNGSFSKQNIVQLTPLDTAGSNAKFNTSVTESGKFENEKETNNDLVGHMGRTETVLTSDPKRADIKAFTNYSHSTENTRGTMDLTHSKTNTFHSTHTSTSVRPNGIENTLSTQPHCPINEPNIGVNSSMNDKVPVPREQHINSNITVGYNVPATGSHKLTEFQQEVDQTAKDNRLQRNNSNNISPDYTFIVDKSQSEVIKIQHTRTFVPRPDHKEDKSVANTRASKILSSHRTMDDVSAIGHSFPFYGVGDTGKGQPILDSSCCNMNDKGHLDTKLVNGQETFVKEALTNGEHFVTDLESQKLDGTLIEGRSKGSTLVDYHKPVLLAQPNRLETDQSSVGAVVNDKEKDTSPLTPKLSNMGNANIAPKETCSADDSLQDEQEDKALWKPFTDRQVVNSSAEQHSNYAFDGFHGVNHFYSQGYKHNSFVNGEPAQESTMAYNAYRSHHDDNQGGYVHSEAANVQHVLHQPVKPQSISIQNPKTTNAAEQEAYFQNSSSSPSLPSRQPVSQSSGPDVASNIIEHGSLEDEKKEEMKSAHNYENVYVTPYVPKPKTCTAMATSTALARKDFRLPEKSGVGNMSGDSVVSAVASAEATGESPYVAVARATARAATIATASAAKGASQGDNIGYGDKRDVTIMISTSCTLKDNEDSDIRKNSEDVIDALRGDANVAVYTRVAPNPSAVLSDQYQSQTSPKRKLKVSIEQPFVENSGKHSSECTTVEISLPRDIGGDELSHMINDSVNKVLLSQDKRGSSQSTGNPLGGENEALTVFRKGRGEKLIDSCMQNANSVENEKGKFADVCQINTGKSMRDRDTFDNATNERASEYCADVSCTEDYNKNVPITAISTVSTADIHKKLDNSIDIKSKAIEINNNNSVTHGSVTQKESTQNQLCDTGNTTPVSRNSDTMDGVEDSSIYSTESSVYSHKIGDHMKMDSSSDGHKSRHSYSALNSNENQSKLPSHVLPESRLKINEARRRFLEDYNGRSISEQKLPDETNETHSTKEDGKKKKKKKKKHSKKESSKTGLPKNRINDNERRTMDNNYLVNGSSMTNNQGYSNRHRDNPNRQEGQMETHSWNNRQTTADYHSSSVTNPGRKADPVLEFGENNGDTENMADHMQRANSTGTLPKEFFAKRGSRSSLIETDLDTGICTEKPLVYETDLDQLHHANRSSSVSNINTTHCHTGPQQNQKATGNFERTQSMTILSDKKKDIISSTHISRVQSYTTNKESINSEHINRINKSLNKLHIPDWYNSSGLKTTQPVQLENTRRERSRERSPYRVVSPQGRANDGGVPAMIVSTKPVVIQHRVSPVVINNPNKPHMMTGTLHQATGIQAKETRDFQLPSSKWKRESHSFKPIPIKGLHEVGVKVSEDQARTPAKDAYLKLKNNQEVQKPYSASGNYAANVSSNQPEKGELNIAALSNDKRMESIHTYVNIHGELPSKDDEPPPLPPRRPKRPSSGQSWGSYSPTSPPVTQNGFSGPSVNNNNSDGMKGSMNKQTRKEARSESSSSPDVLFDSAYASMYKGYTGDNDTNTSHVQDDVNITKAKTVTDDDRVITSGPPAAKDRVNDIVNKFNANWKTYTSLPKENGTNTRPGHESEVFTESYKHGQYNKSGGSANIYNHEPSTKEPGTGIEQAKSWKEDSNIQSVKRSVNNVVPMANARDQYYNSDFSKTNNQEPKMGQYVSDKVKSRTVDKGTPQTLPRPVYIPPDPLMEKAKASPNRRIAEFAGDVDKSFPMMQYPNSPGMRKGYSPNTTLDTSRDLLEKDSSMDISKGNTTFDDMLDGLLGIPSLNSSMLDTSRTSVKKDSRDTSFSSPSFESPLDRTLRIISEHTSRNVSQGTGDFDNALQVSSATTLDSSADTLDAATSPLDNSFVVKCRNPKCKKQQEISEARKTYKTCHNCYTYYCSRECRKAHWEKHKKKCVFSRVNSHCKHVIKKVHAEPSLNEELSKAARTGYIQKGRGSVLILFRSLEKAANFLKGSFESLDLPLSYISTKEIEESRLFGEHAFELLDLCRTYNPEVKYIVDIVIIANEYISQPQHRETRRDRPVIKKCAKLRLSNPQVTRQSSGKPQKKEEQKSVQTSTPGVKVKEDNDTLILTAVPGADITENMEERKAREICFTNIQMKLRQRGISLRHQYPEVYKKLCMYVSDKQEFSPITLFPTDTNTGRKFMCLIMPNSEPDTEWKTRPDLMKELGFHTEV